MPPRPRAAGGGQRVLAEPFERALDERGFEPRAIGGAHDQGGNQAPVISGSPAVRPSRDTCLPCDPRYVHQSLEQLIAGRTAGPLDDPVGLLV